MNLRRRILLIIVAALIVVTSIYPPWAHREYARGEIAGPYEWLWNAPDRCHVDTARLLIEWLLIAALAGVVWLFTKDKRPTEGKCPNSDIRLPPPGCSTTPRPTKRESHAPSLSGEQRKSRETIIRNTNSPLVPMGTTNVEMSTPEEHELDRKRSDLGILEEYLAQRELELATLRVELRAFEETYLRVVGTRYAELDEIEALIAEARAGLRPNDREANEYAREARSKAEESARTIDEAEDSHGRKAFRPSDSVKKLYREVAKRVHPDLATDEADRQRREHLMAEANGAYTDGDEAALKTILCEWETSPESVKGEGTAAELIRVLRKIAQAQKRLASIDAEMAELEVSDLFQLKSKVDDAAKLGRDLLTEMAAEVDEQIDEAKARFESLC
jgi:DnaJ-domain-containing protein 1